MIVFKDLNFLIRFKELLFFLASLFTYFQKDLWQSALTNLLTPFQLSISNRRGLSVKHFFLKFGFSKRYLKEQRS